MKQNKNLKEKKKGRQDKNETEERRKIDQQLQHLQSLIPLRLKL